VPSSNKNLLRLQKFIAGAGVCSRRAAEVLIADGLVTVNGKTVTELGTKINPDLDSVSVKGKKIKPARKGLIMVNKPVGVICTSYDTRDRKTWKTLVPTNYHHYFTIGRLDFNTSGLLLLTNDGDFSEKLSHPSNEFVRTYIVKINGTIEFEKLKKLKNGIKLSDGMVSANAKLIDQNEKSSTIEISLTEGRNRVVRRIFKKLGFKVIKLTRVSFGPFKISQLKGGNIAIYTEKEFAQIKKKLFNS